MNSTMAQTLKGIGFDFFDNSGANIVVEFVTEQKADSETSNEVKSGWRKNVLLVTQTRLCSFVLNESLQHQ